MEELCVGPTTPAEAKKADKKGRFGIGRILSERELPNSRKPSVQGMNFQELGTFNAFYPIESSVSRNFTLCAPLEFEFLSRPSLRPTHPRASHISKHGV